jgi:hypothetical protein
MCPRCESHVCSEHGVQGSTPWCAICEKERLDDVDFAVAQAKLASPWMMKGESLGWGWRGDWSGDDAAGAVNIVSVLAHVVTAPIRVFRARRAAERAFPQKSHEEITAWRASNLPAL